MTTSFSRIPVSSRHPISPRSISTWSISTLWGVLFGALCVGCGREADPQAPAGSAAPKSSSLQSTERRAAAPKPTPPGAPKILLSLPDFELVDQQGQPFGTTQLRGRVWIANFFFTRCQTTCPIQTAKLAQFQRQAKNWPDWSRVRLVSLSVDPGHDTPEVLAEYARGHQADPAQWKFLTGPRETLWKLSRDGFKLPVADDPQGQELITHSPRFILVDAAGQVRGFYDSQKDRDIRQMTIDLRYLLEETPDPETKVTHVALPREMLFAPWMEERRDAQWATAESLVPRHDFTFHDTRPESGITFRHQVVGDAGRNWRMNHYDHGNGVATADVDGDGLPDLLFLSQVGGCELWRNRGQGRFENITEGAGLALANRVLVSASFADTDNDGDPDLFLTTTRDGNQFFLNEGSGRYRDTTAAAGLDYVGHSSTGEFFDYDRDGRLDLFVTNVGRFTSDEVAYSGPAGTEVGRYYVGENDAFVGHLHPERAEKSLLYHNEGNNVFRDVTEETGLVELGWNGDATPFDGDGDGWPDLYVLNMQGPDQYWRNEEGRRFVRQTRETFGRVPWGGMGVKAFDANQDGGFDLLITNMHVDMWTKFETPAQERQKIRPQLMPASYLRQDNPQESILGNALFLRTADGGFREASDEQGAEMYWPWGLSVGDLNADGWPDVFITASMNLQYRYHPNTVLLNDRGQRFQPAEYVLQVEPRADLQLATPWFDLDCDGDDRRHAVCEGRSGRVTIWGALGSRGSLLLDLDQDGDLDIVTGDFNSPPQILISNLAQSAGGVRWLEVVLRGQRSNRDGLGARISVVAGGQAQHQVHDGQSGYLTQSSAPLYFGLAEATAVERIEVVWPSGERQTVTGPLQANRRLVIDEPLAGVPTPSPTASP
jgi:cytochrome oxidase Cu insertion factor (SCO1/SenC/PrrC family)